MRDKNGVGGLYNLLILRPLVIGLCEFENLPSDNIVGTGEMTRQGKAFVLQVWLSEFNPWTHVIIENGLHRIAF